MEYYPDRWLPVLVGGLVMVPLLLLPWVFRRRWRPAHGLVTAALWLGLMELACCRALVAAPPADAVFLPDPVRGWRVRPGLLGVNEQGFRNAGALAPHADRPRVVAVGDSWTFGWNVEREEAWPARLAERTGWEVVNAGCIGYCLYQARLSLRDLRLPADSVDAVVVSTTRNFLHLNTFDRRPEDALGWQVPSSLYLWLRQEVVYRGGEDDRRNDGPGDVKEMERQHRRALEATLDLCRSRGWPVVVLEVLESPHQTDEYAAAARRRGLPHATVRLPVGDPRYRLPDDPHHCNAAGHAVMAEAVEPLLRDLLR